MANTPHRKLQFDSLDDVLADADRLLERGYVAHGNWNLAQTCGHLNNWMRYPLDGFPPTPLLMRPIFWAMKHTVAKGMARRILQEGFKPGIPTAPNSVPAADAQSDAAALASLRETVERIKSHTGNLHPSPLFGPMDLSALRAVSCKHAELHLGFLEPQQ